VEYLWRFTDRQFGLCEATIRPCRRDCTEGLSSVFSGLPGQRSPWTPALIGGRWVNLGCAAGCRDACGCGSATPALRFDLPVYDVTAVEVDGELLDPATYRVDDHRLLVRQDGGRWPTCQDMSLPLGGEGTWAVTFRTGSPVPPGGQVAAGKLALELAKAACGDKGCALPQRWQSITRPGVNITAALDTFEGLDQGKTGIWIIDSWVASVTQPTLGFAIASPDLRPTGRRTTFGG